MKRRGMALGLAALMTCTALFTTTANAKNKGSDEKETIKFTYWGSGDEKRLLRNLQINSWKQTPILKWI